MRGNGGKNWFWMFLVMMYLILLWYLIYEFFGENYFLANVSGFGYLFGLFFLMNERIINLCLQLSLSSVCELILLG